MSPLREALTGFSSREKIQEKIQLAAFAVSTQGLSALLADASDVATLPEELAAFLYEERRASAARAERLASTLVSTASTLFEEGISFVALKGAALAFRDYPDPALRPMGDLDLLLRDPARLADATRALLARGWRALFDTPRHRVFAREDERVVRPATEDPANPIRIELHVNFRLPVLGRVFDATKDLLENTETVPVAGAAIRCPSKAATVRHLLFHAAEDFAGRGLRGIQAYDFHLLARRDGVLHPALSSKERERDAAPLVFASDAIERLFPGTFEETFSSALASGVTPDVRRRAAALPPLRYTRPERGWSATLLWLIDAPLPRFRFLLRTLFPHPGEVRANAAPGRGGAGLALAYVRLAFRRIGALFR